MVYLLDEEYEEIRQLAFSGGVKMSAYVKDKLFYTNVTKSKDKISIEKKPKIVNTVTEVKKEIKKVLDKKSQSNLCPVCGSFLNQYGECNNKFKHK